MKTDVLNEYIYTSLVAEIAQVVRRKRLEKLVTDGVPLKEAAEQPITHDDLTEAVRVFEQRRNEVALILKEIRPELP
jgi:hypothetical protein